MDVQHQPKTSNTQTAASKGSTAITPDFKGPRRLAFRIRRRGFTFEGSPSLLIINPDGVWSVTHRRYIRKTRLQRFRDLNKELQPEREKVRSYKMSQWEQYKQDEELRCLRWKLAELYWSLMSKEAKTRTVLFSRRRRQRRLQQRRLNCFTAAVVLVALAGFMLLRLVLMGRFSLSVSLFLGLGYFGVLFLLDMMAKGYVL